MRGLLLKDLYQMKVYCRSYVVIVLVFSLVGVFTDNPFFLVYPALLVGMIPANMISYDTADKWDIYCGTLPCTRKESVSEKYVLTLMLMVVATVFLAVLQVGFVAYRGQADWEEVGQLLLWLPVCGLLFPSLFLPAIYRFGVEKGRVYLYALMIAVFGGVAVLNMLEVDLGPLTRAVSLVGSGWLYPLVYLALVILLVLSWAVSVWAYGRREIG